MPSVLGLDLGEKRVGVAVSDEMMTIATPILTLAFSGRRQLLQDLRKIFQEYSVDKIIVGFPITMKGEIDIAAKKVSDHVDWFRKHDDHEWILWEERLSTKEAARALEESPYSGSKKRQIIDRIAAQKILQNYLDTLKNQQSSETFL